MNQRVLVAASTPPVEQALTAAVPESAVVDIPGTPEWRTVIASVAGSDYDVLLVDTDYRGFNVSDLAYLIASNISIRIVVATAHVALSERMSGFPKDRLFVSAVENPVGMHRVVNLALDPDHLPPNEPLAEPGVVALASSTGGPGALDEFFRTLTTTGPPILIIQHMPEAFVPRLALRLGKIGAYSVSVAEEGSVLTTGEALMCPGDAHLELARGRVSLDRQGPIGGLIPRADVTFRAVAALYRHRALGIVMTGLGDDGLGGARQIAAVGGQIMAQDAQSSVIDGMPGNVRRSGLARAVGRPSELAQYLMDAGAAVVV